MPHLQNMTRFQLPKTVLAIAQSARMLVKMAQDSGLLTIAVDQFADLDTGKMANAYFQVKSLNKSDLISTIEQIKSNYAIDLVIYGSGFESCSASLTYLNEHWPLAGNPASCLDLIANKVWLFSKLEQLNIRFPMVSFTQPNDSYQWIQKPFASLGGQNMVYFQPNLKQPKLKSYWQRYCPGQNYSALFNTDGKTLQILGFNQQFSIKTSQSDFAFSAIKNQAALPLSQQQLITDWLYRIVESIPLRGLASLDFIFDGQQCWFLEINPRIPASAQLYGPSLLEQHLSASNGYLSETSILSSLHKVYKVFYAPKNLAIPEHIAWPNWVVDCPPAGAFIGQGEPICSIIVSGKTSRQVSFEVFRRQRLMEKLLKLGP